jgi:hypothetical protein
VPRGKAPKKPFGKGDANPGSRARRKETGAGRVKGTPNKVTIDMRQAILNAFTKMGGEGYLIKNKRDFRAMAGLLRAVIPQEIKQVTVDPDEAARKIRERNAAIDQLTAAGGEDEDENPKDT